MTTKERLIKGLVDKGMFQGQAEQVFKQAEPQLQTDNYQVKWDAPAEGYPEALYFVLGITLDAAALDWIDTNCPQAWFRPMFAE